MRLSDFRMGLLPARCAGALVLAVFASAIAASLVVQGGYSSRPANSDVAGIEAMVLLREEHALVAGYAAGATQAQHEANLAAEQDIIRMKVAAAEQAVAAEKPTLSAPAEAKTAVASAKPRKVAPREPEPVQPPLQLASMMNPVAPPAPAGNIVTRKVRDVVATVERIPGWVREAANWVVDLPAQSLPRWPDRRFLHVSL